MNINLSTFPPDKELFNEEAERVANRLAQVTRDGPIRAKADAGDLDLF